MEKSSHSRVRVTPLESQGSPRIVLPGKWICREWELSFPPPPHLANDLEVANSPSYQPDTRVVSARRLGRDSTAATKRLRAAFSLGVVAAPRWPRATTVLNKAAGCDLSCLSHSFLSSPSCVLCCSCRRCRGASMAYDSRSGA